jgi:hypothetical protein
MDVVKVEAMLPSDCCLKVGLVMQKKVWHVLEMRRMKNVFYDFRVFRILPDF